MNTKEFFMKAAIEEAKKAAEIGEVPIGAVVVYKGEIISRGFNSREGKKSAINHAEILAIDSACKFLGGWRLFECDIYVTLEPCPMCAGAIINSRIKGLFYGACDSKAGCCKSVINLFDLPFNHRPYIEGGILEDECSSLLKTFFSTLRIDKNGKKALKTPLL